MVYGSGLGSFGRDLVFVQDAAEMDNFGGRQIKDSLTGGPVFQRQGASLLSLWIRLSNPYSRKGRENP